MDNPQNCRAAEHARRPQAGGDGERQSHPADEWQRIPRIAPRRPEIWIYGEKVKDVTDTSGVPQHLRA